MNSFEKDIKLKNDLQRFNIEKSIIGSEAYNIDQDLMKGVSQEEILEKAKSGVYKPTKQNIKEGIAGQKYGSEKKEEIIPKNKMIISFKKLIDSDTNYVNYPSSISAFTLDKLKEYQTKAKNFKKADSYNNLKDSTKDEIDYIIHYINDKISDLKEKLKKNKEMEKKLSQYGHSTSYLDKKLK